MTSDDEKGRPHPWLPDRTNYGDAPTCDNCRYDECENRRSGFICGAWVEAEAVQVDLFSMLNDPPKMEGRIGEDPYGWKEVSDATE